MGAAGVIAGVGLGIQAYGMIKSGEAEADSARREAANRRLQSVEAEKAGAHEETLVRERGLEVQGAQAGGFAQGGIEVSGGSPLLVLEQTAARANAEALAVHHAASFRSSQYLAGADQMDQFASDRMDAAYVSAFGSILSGAGNAYSRNLPNSRGTTPLVGG